MISEIRISNYKSFKDIKLELKRFNVLIGANASGKSNLVSVFSFLRDLAKHGLKDAISMHGGNEYIKNLNLNDDRLSIGFNFDFSKNSKITLIDKDRVVYNIKGIEKIRYDLEIDFKDKNYTIRKEEVFFISKKIECNLRDYEFESIYLDVKIRDISELEKQIKLTKDPILKRKLTNKLEEAKNSISRVSSIKIKLKERQRILKEKLKDITHLIIKRKENRYYYLFQGKNREFEIELDAERNHSKQLLTTNDRCLFESGLLFQIEPLMLIRDFLNNISLYDIDPKSAKNISLITGKTELESDGSNLVIAMKNLSEKTEERKKFIQLLKDFLPFIEDIETEKIADRLLLTTLKEKYSQKIFIPAPLISDGTMNISALIYILLFEDKPFLVFEEPERSLHPRLVSKLISLMKDVSKRMQEKQIIITTHNPQILKYTEIENLLLIYRDKEGFSQISLPSQNKQVKIFLENELGIDDLFIQNLLG